MIIFLQNALLLLCQQGVIKLVPFEVGYLQKTAEFC